MEDMPNKVRHVVKCAMVLKINTITNMSFIKEMVDVTELIVAARNDKYL